MAKKPSFDAQAYTENIDRVSNRLLVLEKEYEKENLFIKTRNERLETIKDGFEKQIQNIKTELEVIRENLNFLNKNIGFAGKSMQDVAKKDDVRRIGERIDAWPLEHFVKR